MPDDAAPGQFPPPDGDESPVIEAPDPAFGETDDDDDETPDPDEPE
jgi:hypothetical protein